MLRVLFFLLVWLVHALPVQAANTHGNPNLEQNFWWGDASGPYVVEDCLPPVPASSLTFDTLACKAYVRAAQGELIYVTQPAAPLTLATADGTHWLAVCRDTTSPVVDWTRQTATHYVHRQSVTLPADPVGCLVVGEVTVAGSVITAVQARFATNPRDDAWHTSDARWRVTCRGASDDTAALQAMLSAAPDGQQIVLSGSCGLTSTVSWANKGLRLSGAREGTLRQIGQWHGPLLQGTTATGSLVEGLRCQGTNATGFFSTTDIYNQSDACLEFITSSQVSIRKIRSSGMAHSVWLSGSTNASVDDVEHVGFLTADASVSPVAGANYLHAVQIMQDGTGVGSERIQVRNLRVTNAGGAVVSGALTRQLQVSQVMAHNIHDNCVYFSSANDSTAVEVSCRQFNGSNVKMRGSNNVAVANTALDGKVICYALTGDGNVPDAKGANGHGSKLALSTGEDCGEGIGVSEFLSLAPREFLVFGNTMTNAALGGGGFAGFRGGSGEGHILAYNQLLSSGGDNGAMLIDNVSHLLVHGNVIHGATVDGLVIQNSDKMSVLGNHLWDAGTAPFKAITNSYGISAGNVISGTSKVFNYDTSNPGDHVLHMLNVADTGSLSTLSMNHSVNMALYNMPGGFPSLAPSAVAVAGGQMTLNSGTLYIASGVASAADWMPLGSRTVVALAANSGTPSVQSGNVFRTSNSVATTYTNFTNGREGETITIIVGDGVTTFDCTGSSIKCNLLADFVASGGDVFQCTLWNSNWYCTIGNN